MSLPDCTRTKLLEERVVYLGGDTRKQFLARIENGMFIWDKDGRPINSVPDEKEGPGVEYSHIVDYLEEPLVDLPTKEERIRRDKVGREFSGKFLPIVLPPKIFLFEIF